MSLVVAGRPKTQRLEVPGSFSPPGGHVRHFSSGASSASGSVAGSAINAARKKSSLHSGVRRNSLRGKGGKLGGRRISIAGCLEAEGGEMLEPPGPPTTQAAAWQMKTDTVMQRVTLLFNCQTMSDVVFHVGMHQIPAHKFVLACSSPVLYQQLLQANAVIPDNASAEGPNEKFSRMMLAAPSEGRAPSFAGSVCRESRRGGDYDGGQSVMSGMTGLRQGGDPGFVEEDEEEEGLHVTHVEVRERYEDFFELLRFLYCDEVGLSLKNVVPLIFMSEEFKLPALSERCLAYLRAEVRPEGALQILAAVRVLMSKAVMSLWRDIVSKNKALRAYKEMNLVERKRRLAALRAGSMSDTGSVRSGATSVRRGGPPRRSGSRESAFHGSEASFSQFAESEQGGALTDASGLGAAEAAKIAAGTRQAKYATFEKSLYRRLTLLSEELWERCWRNIREHTEAVLAGDDWLEQTLRVVRAVLSIDTCNISEAQLFRHLNRWVEHQCKRLGYPLVPEYRKKVLGEGTLELIRFPVMKLEEVMWEVVPAGVLTYEEVHSLQAAIVNGTSVMKRFNGEPRQRPLHDLMQEAKDDGPDMNGRGRSETLTEEDSDDDGRRRRRSSFSSMALSADQKELHAILGSRLWRSHVDTFCEEQEEHGLAFEAIEACRARDAVGSQRDHLPKQPAGLAPAGRRPPRPRTAPLTGGAGGGDGSGGVPRRASLQSQMSNPAVSSRGGQRTQRLTRFRPAVSRRPGSVSPMLMHGQSLRAEATRDPRALRPMSASPTSSSPGASPSPPSPGSPVAQQRSLLVVGPASLAPKDFEAGGAAGLYRFRGERALEVRLIGGAPYAVDYGNIGAAVEPSDTAEVGELFGLDIGLEGDEEEEALALALEQRELSGAMWRQACERGISLSEAKERLYLARTAKAEGLAEPLDAFINATSIRAF
eukprot:CAMPEP_0206478250 /NCGR_PEP_ID=MMETSP0324_2-20121206/35915_1 /ASSEMBLY_ACC=CAM_ASM_000836 /TAXON_ID=2866 /ORGANISM="Crypthecodinium cohnii, Strain Seligo" /LENGTH=933 /DNA_ID=CAMNT_0053954467 /DNA_START=235 /DNA_END=3036 /DNA_ORIENTATION=+